MGKYSGFLSIAEFTTSLHRAVGNALFMNLVGKSAAAWC
jgi:hypothetical protein